VLAFEDVQEAHGELESYFSAERDSKGSRGQACQVARGTPYQGLTRVNAWLPDDSRGAAVACARHAKKPAPGDAPRGSVTRPSQPGSTEHANPAGLRHRA